MSPRRRSAGNPNGNSETISTPIEERLPATPDDAVLDAIAELGPREMRRAILNAFGNAKLAGHDEIREADLNGNRAAK